MTTQQKPMKDMIRTLSAAQRRALHRLATGSLERTGRSSVVTATLNLRTGDFLERQGLATMHYHHHWRYEITDAGRERLAKEEVDRKSVV